MQLLDASWRKKYLSKPENVAVRAAFNGLGNAQFHPYKGWRLSGFGITSHMHGLKFCVYHEHLSALRDAAAQVLQIPSRNVVSVGLPILIVKPPSKSKSSGLKSHIDSGSLLDMYNVASSLHSQELSDMLQWARRWGIQSLAHVSGATASDSGGHTMGLRYLNISRYLTLLTLFHYNAPHPSVPTPQHAVSKKATGVRVSQPEQVAALLKGDAVAATTPSHLDVLEDITAKIARKIPNKGAHKARYEKSGGPQFVDFFAPSVLEALNSVLRVIERLSESLWETSTSFSAFTLSFLRHVRSIFESDRSTPKDIQAAQWLMSAHLAGLLEPMLPKSKTHARAMRAFGHRNGRFVAVSESRMTPTSSNGAYVVAWPKGTPHRVAPTGETMRMTLVTHMQPLGESAEIIEKQKLELDRTLRRAMLLAAGKIDTIRKNPELMRPFAGGIVHRHTETEFEIHPHFKSMYADTAELQLTKRAVETWLREAMESEPEAATATRQTSPRRRPKKRKADSESKTETAARRASTCRRNPLRASRKCAG
eukprot:g2138.t1